MTTQRPKQPDEERQARDCGSCAGSAAGRSSARRGQTDIGRMMVAALWVSRFGATPRPAVYALYHGYRKKVI